jgi:hypothetical protein
MPRSNGKGILYPAERVIESPLLLSMGISNRDALNRIRAKAPGFLASGLADIKKRKVVARQVELARAIMIGRDPDSAAGNSDVGPSIRRRAIRARGGKVLREADRIVERVTDPDSGTVEVRRARRADPLVTLFRLGSIERRHVQAGDRLRDDMCLSEVHIASGCRVKMPRSASQHDGISDHTIKARDRLRAALGAVAARDRRPLLWVLRYGSISGLAREDSMRPSTVSTAVHDALAALSDHYDQADNVRRRVG